MVSSLKLFRIVLLIVLPYWCIPLDAGLYRWVDSNGKVHYTDVIPPNAAPQGHSELDKQGMTRKVVPAAPTPEALDAQQRSETLARLRAEKENEQQRRDNYLLANYASLAELEAVFKSKLSMLENSTRSMQERRNSLNKRLEMVKKQVEGLQKTPQRKTLESYISDAETTLRQYDHALQENQTEQDKLHQDYQKDKARLSELLKESPSSPHPDPSKVPTTPHEERDRQ